MLYRVYGQLNVKLWCECPRCDGIDAHRGREKVEIDIEAESPEEAVEQAMRQIKIVTQRHTKRSLDRSPVEQVG